MPPIDQNHSTVYCHDFSQNQLAFSQCDPRHFLGLLEWCNGEHDDDHPLVGLLEGENEGVDVSQVVFEEVHQLVYVGLL